jgi:hypothetical protein
MPAMIDDFLIQNTEQPGSWGTVTFKILQLFNCRQKSILNQIRGQFRDRNLVQSPSIKIEGVHVNPWGQAYLTCYIHDFQD